MENSQKILVSGDVNGKFSQLFKRIALINQKSGPFSFLLCVGEFFSREDAEWKNILNGTICVPLPTYVLGPNSVDTLSKYPNKKGCELAENIIYLGPYGIYPCSSGLRIAYLSGRDACSSGAEKAGLRFSLEDVKRLEAMAGAARDVDVLVTSQWPEGVCRFAKAPDGVDAANGGSVLVSRLAKRLKPRYHFVPSAAGLFYERLPYRNHEVLQESPWNVTRFVSVAGVGNAAKSKWLYAFNATPLSRLPRADLVFQPPDVTEHPYPADTFARAERLRSEPGAGGGGGGGQFFYDMSGAATGGESRGRKRKGQSRHSGDKAEPKRRPQPKGPCWFCLSSPEVEKHLVVSVGEFTYLALAKGGLVPDHLLILPIDHFQSSVDLDADATRELEKFKSGLRSSFAKQDKSVVFFERNYLTQHLQVQCVPVPSRLAPILKQTFVEISESRGIKLDEVSQFSEVGQLVPAGAPYFLAEMPSGQRLLHRISKNFPINYGRELLAAPPLLNMAERANWRECQSTAEEEAQLRDRARAAFQPFDFTLEDDSDSDE